MKTNGSLFALCDAGANGNETSAVACMEEWHARIPAIQAQLERVRHALWAALPNVDSEGKPLSGSYWCETDYDDLDFRISHWGTNYDRLVSLSVTACAVGHLIHRQ